MHAQTRIACIRKACNANIISKNYTQERNAYANKRSRYAISKNGMHAQTNEIDI